MEKGQADMIMRDYEATCPVQEARRRLSIYHQVLLCATIYLSSNTQHNATKNATQQKKMNYVAIKSDKCIVPGRFEL